MGFVGSYIRNYFSVLSGRQPVRPLMFSYYVTHQCRLNCAYCCDGDGRRFAEDPVPELSTGRARELVSILSRSADTLDVTGGEPLLREDLEDILAHAREKGMRTILNTKGMGLESRPDILRHCDVLVLSIDTLNIDRLAALIQRPAGPAIAILKALKYAIENRGNVRIVLSAVATPANLRDVEAVLEFAVENGLGFHLSPEIVGTKVNEGLRSNQDYTALLDKVLRFKRERRGILGIAAYLRGIRDFSRFACHPLLMPVIRPDGRMYYPCLESKNACINVLDAGSYPRSLALARKACGDIPTCGSCCHIFCHMALSLLQRHPFQAIGEAKHFNHPSRMSGTAEGGKKKLDAILAGRDLTAGKGGCHAPVH